MSSEVHIGWDGKCKDHPTTPSLARPAPPVEGKVFSASLTHARCGRTMFARVLEVHCARGHQYLAIDTDEVIHDPFTEDEDRNTITDTEWKIMGTSFEEG